MHEQAIRASFRATFMSVESNPALHSVGFALLRTVIGQENSRQPLNQSDTKLKPIVTLVTRVFPLLTPVTCIYFEFPFAASDANLCSDWPP